ncbi:hypothetical protein BH10ACI3_BH10ACI3_10590 [soil metagenome]
MNNTSKLAGMLLLAVALVTATSCQKTDNKNTANNSSNSNANVNQAVNTSTPAPASASTSVAGTPTDAYKAAYTARKTKDLDALKKVLSKDIIEFFTMMAMADEKNKKTLDDMLKELCDRPQAATADARNEKINGDKATIEYLDETGKWRPMDFVKEDGAWKLTMAKPEKGDVESSGDDKDDK